MESTFTPVSFTDIDELAEAQALFGWDVRSTQLSCGPNEISSDQFEFPGLVVANFRVAQSQHDVFRLPDGLTLFLIRRANLPVVWEGRVVPPSHLAVVRSGLTHTTTTPAGWDCYEFIVENELVRRTELVPSRFFEKATRVEDDCLPLPEPQTSRFLAGLDACFSQARRSIRGRAPAVDETELYEFVLHGLGEVIEAGLGGSGSPSVSLARRADLVPNARDFMEANLHENLTADEIARELGVSYRVLHHAFRESLGVSPFRFYLVRRLHAVRRKLKSGEASVTEASLAHRFYHPSRFAQHYRRLFGELPSETVKRSRAVSRHS